MNRLKKNKLISALLIIFLFLICVVEVNGWSKNEIKGESLISGTSGLLLDSQEDVRYSQKKELSEISESIGGISSLRVPTNQNNRAAISVGDSQSLEDAMKDVTVTVINITNDFALMTVGAGLELNLTIPKRNITINGNGHTIDFRGRSYWMTFNETHVDVNINNLKMFGRNYWGPVRLIGYVTSAATITFDTISYIGSQLTYSVESNVEIQGDVISSSVNQYMSPFDDLTYTTQTNQVNFEITNITFKENSTYKGMTENADVMLLLNNGKMIAEKNAKVELTRGGDAGEGGYNVLRISGDLVIQESAEITLNTVEGSTRGGIWLTSANSSVLVEKDAQLTINTKGPVNAGDAAPLFGTSNTQVRVDTGGKLFINTLNSGASTRPSIVTGSNSSFIIAKEGTFDVKSDGTGAKSLIQIGSGATFKFADAKRVNLQLDNTNVNSRLVNMTGILDVDVQAVKAWTSSEWIGDTDESFLWSPMYGVKVTNSGTNTTNVVGNSVSSQIQNSFIANFRTQNFRRILFEYIPDVAIGITRPLTNDTTSTTSHIIKGTAYPGAFVRLSLVDASGNPLEDQSLLPLGTIPSQVESEQGDSKNNYHINSDGTGNWSVSLAAGKYLEKGMRIKAYAFLNGKNDTDIAIVLDAVPPDTPILDGVRDQDSVVTGRAEPSSIVQLYREKDDSQIGSEATTNGSGVYSISVPANESPLMAYESLYTKASNHSLDEDGNPIINTSGKSNIQVVIDTIPPTADPMPVTVDLDDGPVILDPNPQSYVTNIVDNQDSTPGKTFRFEFLAGKGLENVEIDKVGGSTVVVRVLDAADNFVDVAIGINIIDSSVSSGETIYLVASDFTMVVSDFDELTTELLLHQEILRRSHAKAWNKITGREVETEILTDGGLTNSVDDYTIEIQALDTAPTTYLIKEIIGTVLEGELIMETADIDFGTIPLAIFNSTVSPPIDNVEIRITDTKQNLKPWQIGISVPESFTSETDQPFLGELEFVTEGGITLQLNETSQVIYQQEPNQTAGAYSLIWDKEEGKGIFLRQYVGNKAKHYSGIVEWTLTDVPGYIIPPVVFGDSDSEKLTVGKALSFQLEWMDEESQSVNLYYDLNGETHQFKKGVPNKTPGEKASETLVVPAEQFKMGENDLTFYAVNKEGETSEKLTKTIHVVGTGKVIR